MGESELAHTVMIPIDATPRERATIPRARARRREGALTYPVRWAAGSDTSFVESSATYARLLAAAGFEVLAQHSRREFAITFFRELRPSGCICS